MKRNAALILISGAVLLAVLLGLHWSTGPHTVRRAWLHHAIPPVLALTAGATAWHAWKRSPRNAALQWWWPVTFMAGGLGFLEGNPATPFLHLGLWSLIVVAVCAGARWYERTTLQQTV